METKKMLITFGVTLVAVVAGSWIAKKLKVI